MRLRSLHPRVSAETVSESMGFYLVIPPSVRTTEPPRSCALRTRVDSAGATRRRTFLAFIIDAPSFPRGE